MAIQPYVILKTLILPLIIDTFPGGILTVHAEMVPSAENYQRFHLGSLKPEVGQNMYSLCILT